MVKEIILLTLIKEKAPKMFNWFLLKIPILTAQPQ